MSEMLKRKIEEQNKLWNRMQEIQRAADEENRDWTAEERTNWDAANAKIDEVSADIERLERARHLESIDYRQVVEGQGEKENSEARREETSEDEGERYQRAFSQFVRHGAAELSREDRALLNEGRGEIRAQGVGTPSAGGYLVPDGYRAVMTETMKAFGGLINHANVITTATGNPLQWPTNNDTSNAGAILAENNQITQQDVTLGSVSLGAYTYTSKLVLVSLQLLQDSVFDIDTWLPRKLGERIGRAVADDLVNGTGTGEPTGLLAATTQGATESDDNLFNTDGGYGYNALVTLEHSIDPAYRASGRCRYVLNDTTLALFRKQTDTQLRPIWQPVPVPGFPATLNGHPYTIDQAMPAATNTVASKPVMFGDFHAGFVVRQALDVQMVRLAERYADYLQVGFFGFMRLDATPDDAAAVKHLAMTT